MDVLGMPALQDERHPEEQSARHPVLGMAPTDGMSAWPRLHHVHTQSPALRLNGTALATLFLDTLWTRAT